MYMSMHIASYVVVNTKSMKTDDLYMNKELMIRRAYFSFFGGEQDKTRGRFRPNIFYFQAPSSWSCVSPANSVVFPEPHLH